MKITYGNVDITKYILEYTRKGDIGSDDFVLLGNTPAYQIDIKIDNSEKVIQNFEQLLKVYDDVGQLQGTYFIYEAPERFTDIMSITGFDFMLRTNVAYDTKLTYPCTIADQLEEIKTLTGLIIHYDNLPKERLQQPVNWYDTTLSCRDYLGWIAECCGMNAYAAVDGTICFQPLSTKENWSTEDIEDYDFQETFTVSRVCFDNGILVLEQGDDSGNTLYLSSNNPYIDSLHNPVSDIYGMYRGLTLVSASNVKIGGLDNLKLFDIVNYLDTKFMCLSLSSSYQGGSYQIQAVDGKLPSRNAEKVTVKYDERVRMKRMEILFDQNNQQLQMIAKEQDGTNQKVSLLEQNIDHIQAQVGSVDTKVEEIENSKMYRLAMDSSKGTSFKNGDIDTTLSVTLHTWDVDVTALEDETLFIWSRQSNDGAADIAWNEAHKAGSKSLDISGNDVNEQAKFICVFNKMAVASITIVNVYDGTAGIPGKDGTDGKDGKTTYFHVKYAPVENPLDDQIGELPDKYIGTYVDYLPEDSTIAQRYTWTKFQGDDGVAGENGENGQTSYLHIRYSNDGGATFTSNNGKTPGSYLGQYTDFQTSDSTKTTDYVWAKIEGPTGPKGLDGLQGPKGEQGIAGKDGTNGKTTYFHVKYSPVPNPTAAQMSETPDIYIGTYVDYTEADSTDPSKYAWVRFQGAQGQQGTQGIPGQNGADGKTSYLHIKYSNDGGINFTGNAGETPGDYIGVCTDYTQEDPASVDAYTWSLIKGDKGDKGDQGPQGTQGPKGSDGLSTYFHVRYSQNADGNPMTSTASNAIYMGVCTTTSSTGPTSYTSYTWSKIKGDQGAQGNTGSAGPKGADGKTSYLHIKYSDDGKTFTANAGETPGKWIGQYVDYTEADSTTFSAYTWTKIEGPAGPQGVQGPKGTDGKQYYTWLKYADTPTSGMSDDPSGKKYMGLAYNKTTAAESSNYSDYTWSLVKGDKGDQGVQGPAGANGQPTYTWIKYATSASGANMSDSPAGKTYIGLAYNKTTASESTTASDYTWSLIKGDKGDKGDTGAAGKDAVTAVLSNDAHTIPCNAAGTPTTFGGANTTMSVFVGSTDTSASWTYAIAKTSCDGTASNSNRTFTVTSLSADIGYVDITASRSDYASVTKRFTLTKAKQGTQGATGATGAAGANGQSATAYWMICSAAAIQKSTSGVYTPASITFSGKSQTGTAAAVNYACRFIIAESTNGTSYTTKYTSAANEASKAYTPSAGIKLLKCTMYQAGATSVVLDEQIIPIVVDGSTGAKGDKGDKGDTGAAGKGVKSIVEQYYLSTSATTQSGGSWVTTPPAWVNGRYFWTRSIITYTDNSTETTPAICVSGAQGPTGSTGATGQSGVGISAVDVLYYLSTSSTAQSGGSWVTTAPAWVNGKYMWSKTKITYTNGTTKESAPVCITGAKGATGDKGATGATGPAGPKGPIGETLSNGKLLYRDPIFASGNNSIVLYNNSGNGTVKLERINRQSDCPSDSQYQIKISNTGTASPGIGGFSWGTATRANAIFIYRIIAKIPTGRKLSFATNATGSGSTQNWLTAVAGTGKYEEYIFKLTCGSTGTFSSTGYFYIDGAIGTSSAPVEWYLAYATCFDMTGIELDYAALIENTKTQITVEYTAAMEALRDQINLLVKQITTTENGLSALTQSVSNEMNMTSEAINFVKTSTKALENIVNGKIDTVTLEEYIRFNGASIELGKTGSNFKAVLNNSELGFYQSNTKIAYISNNELNITDAVISNSLSIGKFMWYPRANGNLSLKLK